MKVIVKIGGSLMKNGVNASLVHDIAALAALHQIIVVHGGGDVVTEYANRLGKEQRFVVSADGIRSRYTDRETAEIYQMVMSGLLAKRLVAALNEAGVRGVSLAGADGLLLQGKRKVRLVIMDERGRKVAIEGGYTGKVSGVNTSLLETLLTEGYLPVISPVATGESAEPLNVDGDRAASSVAASLGADAVVFLTNVDGLKLGDDLIFHLTPSGASSILPKVGFGMQKKLMAAIEAVEGGVKEAIISSGTRSNPLKRALDQDGCTVISER